MAALPRRDGGRLTDVVDRQAVVDFLHLEARLADEARYAEWLALWTDDAVYWVPARIDADADPERHLSHIYDNRARLDTRVAMLRTGQRYSQEPASRMRRLISNIEIEPGADGALVASANFILGELSIQARHALHLWIGRTTHPLRPIDGTLRMSHKKVVLINADEPLPNLSFLI